VGRAGNLTPEDKERRKKGGTKHLKRNMRILFENVLLSQSKKLSLSFVFWNVARKCRLSHVLFLLSQAFLVPVSKRGGVLSK